MGLSIFKTQNSTPLNASEAYNIWNRLREMYISRETNLVLRNFVHDRELLLLINNETESLDKQVEILEKLAREFKLKLPSRPPLDFKISQKTDDITDKFIFKAIYNDFLVELIKIGLAARTSVTNDNLRKIFVQYLLQQLERFNHWYKYGKIKGWTDIAPSYITGKQVEREDIAINEADHLWDHISTRYDQIQQTRFYLQIAHDIDFKSVLVNGINILKKQVEQLEKIAIDFEVPLPERPPASIEVTVDPEIIEDSFMFRRIFTGMQSTMDLHVRAFIESTRNDNLRKVFVDLLKTEINTMNNYIKFGKLKGWIKIAPSYKGIS